MRKIVIIPTYDERENVGPIAQAVFKADAEANILFVDDNSPDGTGQVIDELIASEPRIHVVHKPGKSGLGRAYITGYQWAIERQYDLVFGMDADFSHDPAELPHFVRVAERADLVLGSRYVEGIRITNWPLSRLLLSKISKLSRSLKYNKQQPLPSMFLLRPNRPPKKRPLLRRKISCEMHRREPINYSRMR